MLGNRMKLDSVCSKIGSGSTPRGGKEVYKGGATALIRSQNIYNDGFHRDGLAFIDDLQAAQLANVEVKPDDVLLNITGDSVARCCQVARDVLPARVNQHVAIIRPDPAKLDARFLRYVLASPSYQSQLLALASAGATRNALTKGMIEALEIEAPGLPEQKAIARILGTLDDKIELNRRMNATLEAMARALFQSWLESYSTEIEEHRVQSLIDARALLIGDGYRAKNSEMAAGGLPFLRAGNLNKDGLDLSGAEILGVQGVDAAGHKLGQAGDVAFTSKGTVGRITRVSRKTGRFVYSPQVCFWRSLAPERLHPNVLYRWMSTDGFMLQVNAVSRQTDMAPYVSLQDQRKMVIQLPPIKAQSEIVKQLEAIDDKIAANAEQSRTLVTLRDTLLPKLLSGELSAVADVSK